VQAFIVCVTVAAGVCVFQMGFLLGRLRTPPSYTFLCEFVDAADGRPIHMIAVAASEGEAVLQVSRALSSRAIKALFCSCRKLPPGTILRPSELLPPPRPVQREFPAERTARCGVVLFVTSTKEVGFMSSIVRCKMRVSEVAQVKNSDGTTQYEKVNLAAVYGAEGTENAERSKWTPSASFEIQISNPNAFGKLSSGHEYYVDFTPAAAPAATA
jgi:hypothetical protein